MHAPESAVKAALGRDHGRLDLRGASFDQDDLDRLIGLLGPAGAGRHRLDYLDCRKAHIDGPVTFEKLILGAGNFDGARCSRGLNFTNVDVLGVLDLSRLQGDEVSLTNVAARTVTLTKARLVALTLVDCPHVQVVHGDDVRITAELIARRCEFTSVTLRDGHIDTLDLARCLVGGVLDTSDTRFGHLVLDGVTVKDYTSLSGISVNGHASMRRAKFEGPLRIHGGAFKSSLSLNLARCSRGLIVSSVTVGGDLGLERFVTDALARFDGVAVDGAIGAYGLRAETDAAFDATLTASNIDFSRARFASGCSLTAACDFFSAAEATFEAAVELRLKATSADADASQSECRANLSGVDFRERAMVEGGGQAVITDLTRTRCDTLQLSRVLLRRCRFRGATGLDELGLTGESFDRTGDEWGRRGRLQLQEEQDFEAGLTRAAAGTPAAHDKGGAPANDDERDAHALGEGVSDSDLPPDRRQLAQLYRSLRKGLEDSKDAPGAADFYISEMEMRRQIPGTPLAERCALLAYRLVGGYGVRPLRPAMWLVTLLLTATIAASTLGAIFKPKVSGQSVVIPSQNCRLTSVGKPAVPTLSCPGVTATATAAPGERVAERNPVAVAIIIARSSFGFSRALDEELRPGGQMLIVLTRLLGAVLLAFVILGFRAMVRR